MDPSAPSAPARSWTGVEHRHLASLAAVARSRSFRRAAGELGYSQSALSHHVAQLERLVGVRLVERRRGCSEVALSAEGEALMRHVAPILAIYRAAQADLEALTSGGPGTLRLGVAEHVATVLPGEVLPAFLRRHPGIAIELTGESEPGALAAALGAGTLDVVVGDPPDDAGALELELLMPEPYVLIAPAAWAVVQRAGARPAELLGHLPIAVNGADPDAARLTRELRAAGIAATPAARAPSLTALVAHVVAGTTAAIVPASAVAGDARMVVQPLDGLLGARPLAVLWHGARRHAPLVDAFVTAVVDVRGRVTQRAVAASARLHDAAAA